MRFTGVASDGGTLVKVVTDSVNNLTDRIKVYNGQFVARTAYNRLSDAYNWQRIYLYHSISMNAENQEETY